MSDFFQEKKNSQLHFRQHIDKFLKQSPAIAIDNQLDLPTLTTIMTGLKGDIVQNNRINLEKLFECLKNQIYGYQLNFSDFQNIFGTQKFIKISEMSAILKSLDLQSFNLKQEVMQMCFENKKWKYSKVDKSMKEMGYQELNQKNKEIVIDCFDFNGDSAIDENDLDYLVEMIREYRSKSSEN